MMNLTTDLPLTCLQPHPHNSNVMPRATFETLKGHLARASHYPPIIVRPLPGGNDYQILDGHHRVAALRQLERTTARCDLWEIDDDEALLLMATLNRLEGQDDPKKRAALLGQLAETTSFAGDLKALAASLPERVEQLEKLLTLREPIAPPRPPVPPTEMPVAVHFFLLPWQRTRLERRLREVGGGKSREEALMKLAGAGGDERLGIGD